MRKYGKFLDQVANFLRLQHYTITPAIYQDPLKSKKVFALKMTWYRSDEKQG